MLWAYSIAVSQCLHYDGDQIDLASNQLLFLIVWCGVFGRKEIVGVLKTMSVLCLTSSFYFSEPILDWFSVWRNQLFSSILDLLDLCNFCIWYVHPCILPVYLGVFFIFIYFLYMNKSLLLIHIYIYIYKALQLANGMHPCVTINRQGSAYCSHLLYLLIKKIV